MLSGSIKAIKAMNSLNQPRRSEPRNRALNDDQGSGYRVSDLECSME